jgi:UDP-N-acetyl-D-glucosamine dehydrogenase
MKAKGAGKTVEILEQAQAELCKKCENKTARVGIIGLGYVGLPLALLFARKGFSTSGFDIDPGKVERLLRGESYLRHVPADDITHLTHERRFQASTEFAGLRTMDAIVICVPTPLDEHREPDLSYIRNTAEMVRQNLQPGQLVILESTTYPGTTEEVLLPVLTSSGLRCPVSSYQTDGMEVRDARAADGDFFLAFSPEREDPGNRQFQNYQVTKVIGAVNGASAAVAQALYRQVFDRTHLVSSARVAEMTKLLENIFRCVNIALVNEVKLLCLRMGLDVWEVIEAARTKPFGFMPFYPGPGLGGHCIPIDPFYLTWKAREYGFPTRFIELAGEVNSAMPEYVVVSIADALNERKQCLRGAKILVLGVAYKKDIDDLRESPALRIMGLLIARGARVDYHDPYVPRLPKMRHYKLELSAVELTPEKLAQYDAVVIATDHSTYDYAAIVRHANLVIDTRNATRAITEHRDKIVLC